MSEADYQHLINRMLDNATSPMISSDTGVEAAQQVGQLAAQEEIEWAVASGLAMYFYGSPRTTKDVDIIASQNLSLTPEHRLSFSGRKMGWERTSRQRRLNHPHNSFVANATRDFVACAPWVETHV